MPVNPKRSVGRPRTDPEHQLVSVTVYFNKQEIELLTQMADVLDLPKSALVRELAVTTMKKTYKHGFELDYGYDPELAKQMINDPFKAPEQRKEAQEFLDSL